MFLTNLLRSIIFAIAALVLIFIQDHSVVLGATVLLFVTALVGFVGLFAVIKQSNREHFAIKLLAAVIALIAAMFLLTTNGFLGLQNTESDLLTLRIVAAVFVASIAISEFMQSLTADSGDRLEFRISAGLALIATVIFALAPLNDVNTVGFLSAYFAVSAAQRGIWLASPSKKVRNGK